MPGVSRGGNLTVDHVVPQSQGGSDHLDNLQLLCGACNSVKGDRPHAALLATLKRQGDLVVTKGPNPRVFPPVPRRPRWPSSMTDWASIAPAVAVELLGEPSTRTAREFRWGRKGSFLARPARPDGSTIVMWKQRRPTRRRARPSRFHCARPGVGQCTPKAGRRKRHANLFRPGSCGGTENPVRPYGRAAHYAPTLICSALHMVQFEMPSLAGSVQR